MFTRRYIASGVLLSSLVLAGCGSASAAPSIQPLTSQVSSQPVVHQVTSTQIMLPHGLGALPSQLVPYALSHPAYRTAVTNPLDWSYITPASGFVPPSLQSDALNNVWVFLGVSQWSSFVAQEVLLKLMVGKYVEGLVINNLSHTYTGLVTTLDTANTSYQMFSQATGDVPTPTLPSGDLIFAPKLESVLASPTVTQRSQGGLLPTICVPDSIGILRNLSPVAITGVPSFWAGPSTLFMGRNMPTPSTVATAISSFIYVQGATQCPSFNY